MQDSSLATLSLLKSSRFQLKVRHNITHVEGRNQVPPVTSYQAMPATPLGRDTSIPDNARGSFDSGVDFTLLQFYRCHVDIVGVWFQVLDDIQFVPVGTVSDFLQSDVPAALTRFLVLIQQCQDDRPQAALA